MTRRKKLLIAAGAASVLLFVVLATQQVDVEVTPEDRAYAQKILDAAQVPPLPPKPSYAQELAFIEGVQRAVLKVAPVNKGIPHGKTREPKDLFGAQHGLCYDRSRVIEKILSAHGFETRHIFGYAIVEGQSNLVTLLKPGTPSHAFSEVKTSRGWLLVDSNTHWRSLDAKSDPVSVADLRDDLRKPKVQWNEELAAIRYVFFKKDFFFFYGLYSRHGRFYPPFTPVPDVRWDEFLANL